MNTKNKSLTILVAALLGTSIIAIMGLSLAGNADAEKPTNPNLWGEEASELAQAEDTDNEPGSEMGEHARSNDLKPGPGRTGVGNIDEALPGDQEDHPSGVVDFLCGGPNPNECPDNVAD